MSSYLYCFNLVMIMSKNFKNNHFYDSDKVFQKINLFLTHKCVPFHVFVNKNNSPSVRFLITHFVIFKKFDYLSRCYSDENGLTGQLTVAKNVIKYITIKMDNKILAKKGEKNWPQAESNPSLFCLQEACAYAKKGLKVRMRWLYSYRKQGCGYNQNLLLDYFCRELYFL